jgi:hypothetical protein
MFEIIQSIGPLGSIGFLISLCWLFWKFFASSSPTIAIGGEEALCLVTASTTIASVALVLSGVRDLTQYRPIHFYLSFGFASIALLATLFWLRSKYPRYIVFWKQIAVKPKVQTMSYMFVFLGCIQLIVYWMLPWPVNRFGDQNAMAHFYSRLVGDFHHSIGFGHLCTWLAVCVLTVTVMRFSFRDPSLIQ